MKDALGHGSDPGGLTQDLAAHSNKWTGKGVRNRVYESRGDIKLDDLVVPKDARNQGLGHQYMTELSAIADRHGRRITLTPGQRDDAHGTTSANRLRRFYGSQGFVRNYGRNVDFTLSDAMYRKPR
jgi:GNAT superfamily N-acetyltransferase